MARKYDLTVGGVPLTRAIEGRFPNLRHTEVQKLSNIVLTEIGNRINAGEQLAFVKLTPSGKMELTILGLEVIAKKGLGGGDK